MTEVFTGLPEQDVLLAEFFLEKFLWRHTRVLGLPSDWRRSLFLPPPQLCRACQECSVAKKTVVSVGAGQSGRAELWLESEERGGSVMPELNVWAFRRCRGLHSKTCSLCGSHGNINKIPERTNNTSRNLSGRIYCIGNCQEKCDQNPTRNKIYASNVWRQHWTPELHSFWRVRRILFWTFCHLKKTFPTVK